MTEIAGLIRSRHSTRTSFDPSRRVDRKSLVQMVEAARWAPTAHNMQNFEIIVVDDKRTLEELGSLRSRVSADFLRENYAQLSSTEELRRRKVGVLDTFFPPAWRDPSRFEAVAREGAPTPLSQTLLGCPALLIVVYDPSKRAPASEGDVLGMISLGCVLENMWLTAESLGIGFQVMSVFAGDGTEKMVKEMLGVPGGMKVAYAVRLGYPAGVPPGYPRVRRERWALAHFNRYRALNVGLLARPKRPGGARR